MLFERLKYSERRPVYGEPFVPKDRPLCSAQDIAQGKIPAILKPKVEMIRAKGEKALSVVLGGGGAGGFHTICGALSALELLGLRLDEADIQIGTSAGAITLGLTKLLHSTDPRDLYNFFHETVVPLDGIRRPWNEVASRSSSPTGFWKIDLAKYKNNHLNGHNGKKSKRRIEFISQTKLSRREGFPQEYYSSDQWTHDGHLNQEYLLDIINTSCSVPILHQPTRHKGAFYGDGGISNIARKSDNLQEVRTAAILAPEGITVAILPIPPEDMAVPGVHETNLGGTQVFVVVPDIASGRKKYTRLVSFNGETNFKDGWKKIQEGGYKIINALQQRQII